MPKGTQVYDWYKKFLEGRKRLENEPHIQHLYTIFNHENIQAVQHIIKSDRHVTVSEIPSETRISYGSAQTIISDELMF